MSSSAVAGPDDPPPPPAHTMFALGFTPGAARRHTPTGIITPQVITLEVGIRLGDHVALVAGTDAENGDSRDADADHTIARIGVRWYPFDSGRKLYRFPARYSTEDPRLTSSTRVSNGCSNGAQ